MQKRKVKKFLALLLAVSMIAPAQMTGICRRWRGHRCTADDSGSSASYGFGSGRGS